MYILGSTQAGGVDRRHYLVLLEIKPKSYWGCRGAGGVTPGQLLLPFLRKQPCVQSCLPFPHPIHSLPERVLRPVPGPLGTL